MICNNRNKGSVTRQTDFGCTPLSDIFRGELRSRLQREGEHPTDVIQPFLTLPLNIEVSQFFLAISRGPLIKWNIYYLFYRKQPPLKKP